MARAEVGDLEGLTGGVIGAAIEVHRSLGPGFAESVYEEAMAVELGLRGLPFSRQHPVEIRYKGRLVGEHRLDMLVGGRLILELKAVDVVLPVHRVQVLSYLKSTGLPLALLLNFKVTVLKDGLERIVLSS